MDSTLQGAIIGAAATLGAAGIGYFRRRSPSKDQTVIAVLPDRVAVFKKARELIDSAQRTVIDTTWGNSEENLLPAERAALDEYLSIKESAKKNPKLDYREIYTDVPEDDHRADRIRAEAQRQEHPVKYSAKLLSGLDPAFPMIDFMVVDGRKVILSCLSKDIAKPDHHHLYVESPELSAFLTQYFQICWEKGNLLGIPAAPSKLVPQ